LVLILISNDMSTASEHKASDKGLLCSVMEALKSNRTLTSFFGPARPVFEVQKGEEETAINPRQRVGLNRREEVVLNAILNAEPDSEERVLLTQVYQQLRAYRARSVPLEHSGINVNARAGALLYFEDILARHPKFAASQANLRALMDAKDE